MSFRKIVLVFISILLVLCFTGCQNKNKIVTKTKATIITNVGKTEYHTYQEINDIKETNTAKFDKYYRGAKIELTDTILEAKEELCGNTPSYLLKLKSGWVAYIPQIYEDKIADLDNNSKVKIVSQISYDYNNGVSINNIEEYGGHDYCNLNNMIVEFVD